MEDGPSFSILIKQTSSLLQRICAENAPFHLYPAVIFLMCFWPDCQGKHYTCWEERIKFCFLMTGFHTGSLGLIKFHSVFYKKGERVLYWHWVVAWTVCALALIMWVLFHWIRDVQPPTPPAQETSQSLSCSSCSWSPVLVFKIIKKIK